MSCPSREQATAVFKAMAGDDGKLTIYELRDAMAGKGYDVVKIFLDIDKDGDKVITEQEFLDEVLKTPRTKSLQEFFEQVDTDKSGEVTLDELYKFLETSDKGKDLIADVEGMKKEFAAMDKDGSKAISREEFISFMNENY